MQNIDIQRIPKAELHCHLDGSMGLAITQQLLETRNEHYTIDELKNLLEAPMDCQSLAEYLKRFDLPIRCLQTEYELEAAAKELGVRAAAENVKYLEVRFAPVFHTNEGLKIPQILESVQKGLSEAKKKTGIYSGIIVCGMRHLPIEENIAMLKQAREMLGYGVVACDLAGDEKAFPTADFVDFFKEAKKLDMEYTIHSGECQSVENIKTAIELGAKRIGHGTAMGGHPEVIALCKEHHIGVELCPTSNLQTKAVPSLKEYPFVEFQKAGLLLSVNTDNRTVSQTDCTKELQLLENTYGLTEEQMLQIYKDSIECSFASEEDKNALLKMV